MEKILLTNKKVLYQLLVIIGCAFCALLFQSAGFAQELQHAANYATGKPGTKNYEHFSFWVRKNDVKEISYWYGKSGSESDNKLTYLGKCGVKGEACFKMQFPNGLVLYAVPKGNSLKITDGKGRYNKTFEWEYEGPVDGRGTFCDVCPKDEKGSMKLVKTYFMK
jgi:hypothetical protein